MAVLDKTTGLLAFVKAVEGGSFTSAARATGATPSAITKSVARLESRLQTRLFRRSTRTLSLTREGEAYYERVAPLLRGLEEAEEVLQTAPAVRGQLLVTMPSELGMQLIGKIAGTFLQENQGINLKISVSDVPRDLLADGFDIAFRIGALKDSELICRRLIDLPLILVASREYIDRHGMPLSIEDLARHRWIRYMLEGRSRALTLDSKRVDVPNTLCIDNACAIREAVLNGGGIAQVIEKLVEREIEDGRLVRIFPNIPKTIVPFHAMHGYRQQVPLRARLLIDFVRQKLLEIDMRS